MPNELDIETDRVLNNIDTERECIISDRLMEYMQSKNLVSFFTRITYDNNLCTLQPFGEEIIGNGGWLKHLERLNKQAELETQNIHASIALSKDQIKTNKIGRIGTIVAIIISIVSLIISIIALINSTK